MKNKKAFTLIELIAVLVILAILALIVTPIVLNIVKHSKESANKRSVDAYGKSIELAVANYLLDKGEFPTNISDLEIEYSGKEVICNISLLNEGSSVYLSECKVGSSDVKDKNTSDGWYHYGKSTKATYKAYKIGDEVSYNNVDYYVIKDSGANEEEVQLLKKDPLTVAQVNQYGAGHVNMYACRSSDSSCYQTANDVNSDGTVGEMAYYSSATCGYDSNNQFQTSGCTTDYAQSEVKYAVDAWKTAQAPQATNARLITLDDLTDNLGMKLNKTNPTSYQINVTEDTPTWVMGENYCYWTMTTNTDETADVWFVGSRSSAHVYSNYVQYALAVRPVITIKKSAI